MMFLKCCDPSESYDECTSLNITHSVTVYLFKHGQLRKTEYTYTTFCIHRSKQRDHMLYARSVEGYILQFIFKVHACETLPIKMDSLCGKVVLITGASSGIGEGIAIHLARLGCRLSLTGRNEENLRRVSEECVKAGLSSEQILTIPADINNGENRRGIIESTVSKFGELHVLVNNAGFANYYTVSTITEDNYDELFSTNVRSHVFLTQLAIPYLKKVKGSIVNNSSIAGQLSFPRVGAYCMTKASLDMFTQCLALVLELLSVIFFDIPVNH
ncbi:hypothetical protein ACF0H5_021604 [Mactra antiquata]